MNMTPEQKAQWLDAAQALLDGEPIQWHNDTKWLDTENLHPDYLHRRKPKPADSPRMVPLTRSDVPPGSCLSTTSGEGSWWAVLWAGNYLIAAELGRLEYEELQTKGFQIHRPGDNDADGKPVWRKCEKEPK